MWGGVFEVLPAVLALYKPRTPNPEMNTLSLATACRAARLIEVERPGISTNEPQPLQAEDEGLEAFEFYV